MRRLFPSGQFLLCCLALLPPAPLRAADHWVRVESPYFTVFTTGSAKIARGWAAELERFRLMLQPYVAAPEDRLRPVTVILFPSDRAMRPFKPLEKGKPQMVEGLFVNFCDSHAIGLRLDGDPARTRRIIFHEAVHWYSNASDVALPLWLEEGIAEVYSTFQVNQDTCSFGYPIREHLRMLALAPRWSMARLAATTHESLTYNEGSRATEFYAQAWLSAHYLLFGKDTPGRSSIARYVEALGAAADPAQAFAQAFGMDFAGFNQRLTAYRSGGHYTVRNFPLPAGDLEKTLVARPATEAEVELALGTFLLGARQASTPESDRHLLRAAALAPENPVVWQVLGEGAMIAKKFDDADGYFARAAATGSTSYFVYHCLGFCRLRGQDWAHGYPDAVAARQSLQDFRRALAMNPRFEALAGLMFADETYDARDRELLEHGARLAPKSGLIQVGLAACDLKAGHRREGREELETVLQAGSDATTEARELATRILHSDDWNACMKQVAGLFDQQRYREAVALIDAVYEQFPEPNFRTTLKLNRRNAVESARLNEAVELANNGSLMTAKKRLQEILESDVEPQTRARARRLLEEITRQEARGPGRR